MVHGKRKSPASGGKRGLGNLNELLIFSQRDGFVVNAAYASARRAMRTRKGEQVIYPLGRFGWLGLGKVFPQIDNGHRLAAADNPLAVLA